MAPENIRPLLVYMAGLILLSVAAVIFLSWASASKACSDLPVDSTPGTCQPVPILVARDIALDVLICSTALLVPVGLLRVFFALKKRKISE